MVSAIDRDEAAELLAEDILSNIELGDITLAAVMLKCARLARLNGDEQNRKLFAYEAGGYPSTPKGVAEEVFELGRKAGRVYQETDEKTKTLTERMNTFSIEALEKSIDTNRAAIIAATDPNISISSSNPNQMVFAPIGNYSERSRLTSGVASAAKIIGQSRTYAYEYASASLYEIQFSGVVSTIFDKTRQDIDPLILRHVPQGTQKTAAIDALIPPLWFRPPTHERSCSRLWSLARCQSTA